jgi:hypothetical protein
METSRVSQGQLIAGAGGILLFIALFLHWAGGSNLWNASFVEIWLLVVALAAAIWGLAETVGADLSLPAESGLLVALLGMAALGWTFGFETEFSGSIGVWLALIASIAIVYGGFTSARAPATRTRPRRTAPPPTAPPPTAPPTQAGPPPS